MSEASPLEAPPEGVRPRRVAPLIVLVVAVVIAGFFVVLARAKNDNTDSAYSPLIGKPAPAITSATLDGKSFDLSRRKGSWVILNFFNVTCGPCMQEHPELVKFQSEQAANGINAAELYSVVWDDLDGGTADFFRKERVAWPVLIDKNADISVAFGVAKVPETWIIDPSGVVVTRVIAPLTDDELTRIYTHQVALYGGPATSTPAVGS
jgi:cytochrome c biogenesis protein CcmG/thiol:disulfide interchange protein DsbE